MVYFKLLGIKALHNRSWYCKRISTNHHKPYLGSNIDFVEKESLEGCEYTFTYSELDKSLTNGYKQLRLFVPTSKHKSFQKLIYLKLKSRIESDLFSDIDLSKIQED